MADQLQAWLCIERHSDGQGGPGIPGVSNIPGGPAHCFFAGTGDHLPDCGYRLLVDREAIYEGGMMTETPLPSRIQAAMFVDPKNLGLMDPMLLNGSLMQDLCLPALRGIASGRLVDREAIDRERIEEILNELCRDWGESLEGAGYDFGRAIDALVAAIGKSDA